MGGKSSLTLTAHNCRMLAPIRLLFCAAICGGLMVPAHACQDLRGLQLDDVRYADLVLVGRVQNYRIVRDELERQAIRRLSKDPAHGDLFKRDLERVQRGDLMSGDYAKFDVLVHRQLSGKSPTVLTVTLNDPFKKFQDIAGRTYAFALLSLSSNSAPGSRDLRLYLANREPDLPTVIIVPCSGTFMFEVASPDGQALIARFAQSDHGSNRLVALLLLGGVAVANLGLLWFSRLRPSAAPTLQ